MSKAVELADKIWNGPGNDREYWFALEKEFNEFFDSPSTSDAERYFLQREGAEILSMICEGYRYSDEHPEKKK